ncbi:carbon-nitrogen family hydrolase [Roseiconus nitratireducens]|uniref:Carbon-nitrogen family hydrolase n=1 Tax=Roseiconus nitratireducens TaxID=2605748 RepID=A0A5M6DAW3_9BACT|nr:nitrilase-related carbon-nitrogen hydrolase [Roseiconus nitratireducens]KAA5543159.1 carbon-nitrogen family hydrolase [Roseiconus nitratireducens]
MQVVAVQLNMAWENKAANHQRVHELLKSNGQIQPGALVLVPEMFETGFSMNLDATAQSDSREGEQCLRDLAREFDVAVMGGVAAPVRDGLSANEAVAFAPDGRELVRYRKIKPFSFAGEQDHYRAGESVQLFRWQDVKIAPFLCYDLRFPELFRDATRQGAELFAVIACWPAKRSEHWVRLLQARAIENLAVSVGTNRCGEEPNLTFDGRSCAFDQMGTPLFEATDQEQVITTDIDINAVRDWRDRFPALRDMSAG